MKLPTKLVVVGDISSSADRSQFSDEDIEQLAHLIIEVEGVINPIVLRRTGLESYEVVEGHLEYYAAVRARELSPLKGEMIQAIILEPDNEKSILRQITFLRSGVEREVPLGQAIQKTQEIQVTQKDIQDLKKSILDQITSLDIQGIKQEIQDLKQLVSDIAHSVKGKSELPKLQKPQVKINLNLASEAELLTVKGMRKSAAKSIIEWREKNGNFSQIDDLKKVSGIGSKTIENNHWHEYFIIDQPS